jgi:hypothetical protein
MIQYLSFFLYLWVIFALLDPDPATQINADPDPQQWLKILKPSLLSDESVDGSTNPVDGTASTSGSCGDGARATLTEPREEGEKMEDGAENLSSSKDEDEVHTVLQLLNNFCSIAL